ncbi:MAG: PEGA domain-containing protein [Acidobacteria bacterium]|nr:PEGA domain-containing protein [Acidobacteriota bacterium]
MFVGRYYSPWYFGGSVYSSRYYGYNPFGWRYSPFGYYGLYGFVPYGAYYSDPWDPFMYGGAGGGAYDRDRDRDDDRLMGSVRLRMNPRHAKVYVDGALVGMVDDFDGLRDHLEVDAGRHEIEVRAEGYETYRTEVVVTPGKTTTERAKLKKK